MDSDKCVICGIILYKTVTVTEPVLSKFIESSIARGDGKADYFRDRSEIKLHRSCRIKYTNLKCIEAERKRIKIESEKVPKDEFDFQNNCLFCAKEFMFQQKKGLSSRVSVMQVKRLDTQNTILQACITHDDNWSQQVLLRIAQVNILEKNARYHFNCYSKFCHPYRAAGLRRGRKPAQACETDMDDVPEHTEDEERIEMDITSVCIVCLANRDNTDLLPLGEFEKLYEILAGKNEFADKKLFTCITCYDLFNKVMEFQKKIQSTVAVLARNNDLKNNTISNLKHEPAKDYDSDDNFYDEPLIDVPELTIELKKPDEDSIDSLLFNEPNEFDKSENFEGSNDSNEPSKFYKAENDESIGNQPNEFAKSDDEIVTLNYKEPNEFAKSDDEIDSLNSNILDEFAKSDDEIDTLNYKEPNEFAKSDNAESIDTFYSNEPKKVNRVKTKPEAIKASIIPSNINKPTHCKIYKKVWSDKYIDEFIAKHHIPFDRKYVKELLNYRNKKYKVVNGEELYRTRFDLVVDTRVCADDMEVKEIMKQSRNQQHFVIKKLKCNKCVLAFKGRIPLRAHINENHAKTRGPYECDICGTRASTKETIANHIRSHYNKYVCKLCQHVDCNKQQMFVHFKSKRKLYQCTRCEQSFGVMGQFYRHYKAMHLSFTCDYCKKSFKDRLWFEKHIHDNHRSHRCAQCPKEYPNYIQLCKHVRLAHLVEERSERTYCVECDRHFGSRAKYRNHLHTPRHKPRPKGPRFPCQECGASFMHKGYLKKHINHVHRNQSAAQCDKCSKRFLRQANLRAHVKAVHDKVKRPKDKICQYCGRGFADARILTHHIRTHTGERPHACRLCDAAFAQRYALQTHIKARHKDAGPEFMLYKPRKKDPGLPESGPVQK